MPLLHFTNIKLAKEQRNIWWEFFYFSVHLREIFQAY